MIEQYDPQTYVAHSASKATVPWLRIGSICKEELSNWQIPLQIALRLTALLPPLKASRLRTAVLRLVGMHIERSSVFWGRITVMGHNPLKHLRIGHQCVFNDGCVFDLQAPITIGNHVALGHQVMLLTCSHVIGPAQRRADYRLFQAPISIDDGAWLGARCTVLPGVHIGAGAIIAAGALVQRDVAPNTIVGGIPARLIRSLDNEGSTERFEHLQ